MLNLTPHTINLLIGDNVITIESSGKAQLVKPRAQSEQMIEVQGHALPAVSPPDYETVEFGAEIPSDCEGVIVSAMVGEWVKRNLKSAPCPVYSPDSSPAGAVRNEKGHVIGVKRLVRWM